MEAYLLDWVNLLLRWVHVITAIAWIGSSFYFVFLDNNLQKPNSPDLLEKGVDGAMWAIHGGGFYNHNLFWTIMAPNAGGTPTGALAEGINQAFGSFDKFKEEFTKCAVGTFGSGWAWLCVLKNGELEVCSTANQDNTLMPGIGCGGFPILGLDVWEHAYYLKYQNKRADYITNWWNIINWKKAEELFLDK